MRTRIDFELLVANRQLGSGISERVASVNGVIMVRMTNLRNHGLDYVNAHYLLEAVKGNLRPNI